MKAEVIFLAVMSNLVLGCQEPAGTNGIATSIVFAGERDGNALSLGTATTEVYADVPGADAVDGDTVFGSGTMLAGGLEFDADQAGVYRAELNVTWALSLEAETVVAWFVLDCAGDGAVVSEQEVKHSLGNANTSAVQQHAPFTVTSLIEFDNAGTARCILQHQLEIAGTGDDIIFHGIDGYSTAEAYMVKVANGTGGATE